MRYALNMPDDVEYLRKLVLENIERKIAVRAYEIFHSRENAEGSALDDWLRAEEEIFGQSISAPLYLRNEARPYSVH
jgi:hypothetical protein